LSIMSANGSRVRRYAFNRLEITPPARRRFAHASDPLHDINGISFLKLQLMSVIGQEQAYHHPSGALVAVRKTVVADKSVGIDGGRRRGVT